MQVVAILNQKGGVAKTTTAHNLAAGLTERGKKVLSVDLDAQQNLTFLSGVTAINATTSIALLRGGHISNAITYGNTGDIVPASEELITLYAAEPTQMDKMFRLRNLKNALDAVYDRYDYCILDCPPALGIITAQALRAANRRIIPVQADVLSWHGLTQTLSSIASYNEHFKPGELGRTAFAEVVITRYNPRTVISRDAVELITNEVERARELAIRADDPFVYDTKIRETVIVKEAQAERKTVLQYAPYSKAARDYQAFTDEFIRRNAI